MYDTGDVDETMAARNDNLGLATITPGGLEAVVTLTNAEDGTDDQGADLQVCLIQSQTLSSACRLMAFRKFQRVAIQASCR